ncbi:MAG: hypothetical protein IT285_08755 [Bdellovibrionales bacterium]|nr:hypothetical protein [Bdellovibrionales bacterium]
MSLTSRGLLVAGLFLTLTSQADAATLPAPLNAKLERIYQRWDEAAASLVDQVGNGGAPIARADWERMLGSDETAFTLTPAERRSLERYHSDLITEARARALRASLSTQIDLDTVRADGGLASRFCTDLPKGGMLHLHPWGTLSTTGVERVVGAVNPEIDLGRLQRILYGPNEPGNFYPGEIDFLTPFGQKFRYSALPVADQRKVRSLFHLPSGTHSFKRFMGVFSFVSALVFSNPQVDPEPIMWDQFLRDARSSNVTYVEMTQNFKRYPAWPEEQRRLLEPIAAHWGVTVKLLAAFNRMGNPERNRDAANKLLELPATDLIVGANLLADETEHPTLERGQTVYATLAHARGQGRTNLRFTQHAGELGDPRNARDAILMGSERLGHAVKLRDDALALELARRRRLAVETNLESNIRLGIVADLREHPFLDFHRLGLPVSLSTDDEGMFRSNIITECRHALAATDIQYSELREIIADSIRTSFADESTQARLAGELDASLARFEREWQAAH